MSDNGIHVVPGPANYFSHPGSLEWLSDLLSADQLLRTVWVYGERALAGAEPFLPAAFHLPEAEKARLIGHCSERNVAELVQASGDGRAVVTGVGGGALLDSAKVLARRLGVPLVAIPTIVATYVAWTPLSVWYSDVGQTLNFEIFDDTNFLVLVEPRIILSAPAEYLLASIGDTLAKRHEAVVLTPQPEALLLTVRLGINGALAIRDVLLASSETALADQRRGDLTQAFRDVAGAIVAGGEMVGGLGERYTRVTTAHTVHDGLTVLPQTDKFLHGTKVAYGILVQSALLAWGDALAQLVQAYQRFNLPTTLATLEVDINNRTGLDRIIVHTLRPGESIHYLPVTLTPEVPRTVFEEVEYFNH